MYQLPRELSRPEEFEHIVTNFILGQEERAKQLEEYMEVIMGDFMQLSLEVTQRLKEKVKELVNKSDPDENSSAPHPTPNNYQTIRDDKSTKGKGMSLIGSSLLTKISIKPSSGPSTPIFSPGLNGYDSKHLGVKFSLGGEPREISLLELGWRVGLYTERKSRENVTLSGLSRAEMVKSTHLLMEFWPNIGDGGFNVGNMKVASIRDPRVKLAHWCIATTISGRKENTNRVIEIDLYYLYCIYMEGVVCNIPYWLAKICVWPATRAVEEDDEAEEEADGEVANEEVGGSAEIYRNISQGDWQVIFDEKKLGKNYRLRSKGTRCDDTWESIIEESTLQIWGLITLWYNLTMSSATSDVTYTSVYTDSEPGRAFWGADDEEVPEGGIPRVIILGYDGLPLQPVALPLPDFILGPENPQTPPVPQEEDERDHEFPAEEQPLPPIDSPTAESPGYITESDPEEDPEGDTTRDEDEDEEDEEEEEHLTPADSTTVIPVDEPVFPPEGAEPVIPPPSTDITIGARFTIRPQTPISLPPEAEVERLLPRLPITHHHPSHYHHPLHVEAPC
ncbi:hypothetical protein Tco_0099695 [Tanacetum coccineum]